MTANPYERMRENAVFTMPKEELTLMLYDGGLKFCNQAIAALEASDYPKTNELLKKAQNIINEFQRTLDHSYEVSQYFDAMYGHMLARLVEANIYKDADIVAEVRDLFREFRDMWKEAMLKAKRESAVKCEASLSCAS